MSINGFSYTEDELVYVDITTEEGAARWLKTPSHMRRYDEKTKRAYVVVLSPVRKCQRAVALHEYGDYLESLEESELREQTTA